MTYHTLLDYISNIQEGLFKPAGDADISHRVKEKEEAERIEKEQERAKRNDRKPLYRNTIFPNIILELSKQYEVNDIKITEDAENRTGNDPSLYVHFTFHDFVITVHAILESDNGKVYIKGNPLKADTNYNYSFGNNNVSPNLVINYIIRMVQKPETDAQIRELDKVARSRRPGGERATTSNLTKRFGAGETSGKASSCRISGNVFFSYATPIAVRHDGKVYVVSKKFSVTTTRTQSRLRYNAKAEVVDVDKFKELLDLEGVHSLGRL
jgi:hypothetical protein